MRAAKLVGKKVKLCPPMEKDAKTFHGWINDLTITRYLMHAPDIITVKDELKWLRQTLKKKNECLLTIVTKRGEKTIGNIALHKIDKVSRDASLGIVIGEKDCWGKGYGTEATILMLDFAFNVLNLHSIYLWVFSYNKRAISAYKKAGFKEAGRLKESRYFAGKYYDDLLMQILAKNFKKSKIKKLVK